MVDLMAVWFCGGGGAMGIIDPGGIGRSVLNPGGVMDPVMPYLGAIGSGVGSVIGGAYGGPPGAALGGGIGGMGGSQLGGYLSHDKGFEKDPFSGKAIKKGAVTGAIGAGAGYAGASAADALGGAATGAGTGSASSSPYANFTIDNALQYETPQLIDAEMAPLANSGRVSPYGWGYTKTDWGPSNPLPSPTPSSPSGGGVGASTDLYTPSSPSPNYDFNYGVQPAFEPYLQYGATPVNPSVSPSFEYSVPSEPITSPSFPSASSNPYNFGSASEFQPEGYQWWEDTNNETPGVWGYLDKAGKWIKSNPMTAAGIGLMGANILSSYNNAKMTKGVNKAQQESYRDYLNAINPTEEVKQARLNQAYGNIDQTSQLAREKTMNSLAARGIRGKGVVAPTGDLAEAERQARNQAYYDVYGKYNVPSSPGPASYSPSTGQLAMANTGQTASYLIPLLLAANRYYGANK